MTNRWRIIPYYSYIFYEVKMKKIRVLICNVSYQASSGSYIKLLRNSQYFDCYIVGCDVIKKGYSSGSMLVDKFYPIPRAYSNQQYISTIESICKNENIDLILSAEEEDLVLFKKYKINQAIYKCIPDKSLFKLFNDKHLANISISKNGIPIPHTINTRADFEESNSSTFIYRERVSCCSRGIRILKRSEIDDKYIFYSSKHITQEFIEGKEYTVDVFCDREGGVRMIVPRVSLALKDGITFKCIIKNNTEIIKLCKKIYSIYCLPGISNIQFIVRNGRAYFIELNPRAASTLIASTLASLNILDLYILHFLLNEEIPQYDTLMQTVKWGTIISRYYEETVYRESEDT